MVAKKLNLIEIKIVAHHLQKSLVICMLDWDSIDRSITESFFII